MKRFLSLALLLTLSLASALAQFYSSTNKKAVRQFEEGIQALQRSDWPHAEQCLLKAIHYDASFAEAYLTLADAYLEQSRYPEAKQQYEAFLSVDKRHKDWRTDAQRGIAIADFRSYALQHPVPFDPQNLGANVNTAYDEYLPALTADGNMLVFTRRQPRNDATTARTSYEEDFYVAQRTDEGWGKALRMQEPVNSSDNEGAATISKDGRIMIFTACERQDGAGRCDLYMCVWHGNRWGRPRNMGRALNTGSWESQPSLSFDGTTLYFVSDRKGGYGGKDIWMSTFGEEGWSSPRNLGPTINTPGDEGSPFIHPDNKSLYFSSTGHIGMGGSDLFVSRRIDDTSWSAPCNLGYPINTESDESNLIVSADGHTAIFSSDKLQGFGRQDLYQFDLPVESRAQEVLYQEQLVDEEQLQIGASITLQNVFFQSGKYALYESSLVELDRVVDLLTSNPAMRIELAGHTDNVGSSEANQLLSEQRAKAVYDYLVSRGIPADRLEYKGYGETRPIADNDTQEGRAQNRRTVFTILSK